MTIVEPYITRCNDCGTIFRFAECDIHNTDELPFNEFIFDCLDGFVRCPTCSKPITSWDKSISSNTNVYGIDILYATCLREALEEICSDKLTTEEIHKVYRLAVDKFHDML